MEENLFKQQMRAFDHWKAELIQVLQDYRHWLQTHGQSAPDIDTRLTDVIDSLRTDRLTIAFVAEFSRGKTELINAVFFSDYNRRLLPSEAGRTTMCPTELFFDQAAGQAYIRLLPIETRLEDASISELKKDLDRWHTIALDVNSPDQMAASLKEVIRTKTIPLAEAEALGLYDAAAHQHRNEATAPEETEVPLWRHALISFPHPLLQQGLAILDTPGLNALGNEPELTLNMLPNCQAVLFVLAADAGVTRSDLDVWQYHIKQYRGKSQKGLAAALNKIDTLWDEMKSDDEIDATIASQAREAANALGIASDNVFPLSAQKALLARARGDDALLERSRIAGLEGFLANDVIPAKQDIVHDNIVGEVGILIKASIETVRSRLCKLDEQLTELTSLTGKNTELTQYLMRKARDKQAVYNKNMEYFQSSQRALNQQAKLMLNELSLEKFDKVVTKTRKQMSNSWTTLGLKTGMRTFFDGMRETMEVAVRHADQTHQLVESIYQKFHEENDLPHITPEQFSAEKYRDEMAKLCAQAEDYRNSPVTTMTEQASVIKKFVISMVSHAREIYYQCNHEAQVWLNNVMVPLSKQVAQHKQMLEQHMATLSKINDSKEGVSNRTRELEQQCEELRKQINELNVMHQRLKDPCGISENKPSKVAGGSASASASA